ncbi:hypothetical protein [Streptomyces subrutilus]|uniref:hypothetical protein n=1 Tax=Streptomyces subrutilus TaxID=36818 RepID=UPI002E15430E|nr:hypothetical protein OG479_10415 [Streptomyces subrutilus]
MLGGDVIPDGSISVKWWLPDGLRKDVLKAIKLKLNAFEGLDLTCGACEAAIEIHHEVVISVQLVRQDSGLGIFLTHALCAVPRLRLDPIDVPFSQGGTTQQIHYRAAIKPTGEPLLFLDISPVVHGMPERHRSVLSATRRYAEAHGLALALDASVEHLPTIDSSDAKIVIAGRRAFITSRGVGITDELDMSATGEDWSAAVAQAGQVEIFAGVGLLRFDFPELRYKFAAVAHGRVHATVVDDRDYIAPAEDPADGIYRILNIAPGAQPTVFMLDSDIVVCIDRWFHGSGKPFTPVMQRQLVGLLTARTLIGSMHVDFTLGVAENCWGRFSEQVNRHRARKIMRALHTVMGLDSEALMGLINQGKRPSHSIRAVDGFSVGMPKKESELQTLSYALVLNLQGLYRKSRGANIERKLRLLREYVEGLDSDFGFVGLYEFQVASDFLFPGRDSSGYAELLLKPGKERLLLESSWGAAWDLTHMRRADLALRGIHWDVPEVAALVSGDKALRLLRDRLTVHKPIDVQGVSTLQMNLSKPDFKKDRDTERFMGIVDQVHDIVSRNLHVSREQNVERALRMIPLLEGKLTK